MPAAGPTDSVAAIRAAVQSVAAASDGQSSVTAVRAYLAGEGVMVSTDEVVEVGQGWVGWAAKKRGRGQHTRVAPAPMLVTGISRLLACRHAWRGIPPAECLPASPSPPAPLHPSGSTPLHPHPTCTCAPLQVLRDLHNQEMVMLEGEEYFLSH